MRSNSPVCPITTFFFLLLCFIHQKTLIKFFTFSLTFSHWYSLAIVNQWWIVFLSEHTDFGHLSTMKIIICHEFSLPFQWNRKTVLENLHNNSHNIFFSAKFVQSLISGTRFVKIYMHIYMNITMQTYNYVL